MFRLKGMHGKGIFLVVCISLFLCIALSSVVFASWDPVYSSEKLSLLKQFNIPVESVYTIEKNSIEISEKVHSATSRNVSGNAGFAVASFLDRLGNSLISFDRVITSYRITPKDGDVYFISFVTMTLTMGEKEIIELYSTDVDAITFSIPVTRLGDRAVMFATKSTSVTYIVLEDHIAIESYAAKINPAAPRAGSSSTRNSTGADAINSSNAPSISNTTAQVDGDQMSVTLISGSNRLLWIAISIGLIFAIVLGAFFFFKRSRVIKV